MLREKDPDLKKVTKFCRAAEITKQELKSMTESNRPQAQIDAVYNQKRSKSKLTPQKRYENEQGSAYHSVNQFCSRCGSRTRTNTAQNCPAWNKLCDKCGGRHHFANMCWTRKEKRLQEVQLEISDDEYFIDAIEESQKSNVWYAHVKVCKSTVKMKIDSGAQTCVIPAKTWYKIKDRPNLERSSTLLRTASGTKGTTMVKMSVGEKTTSARVFVVTTKSTPLLGLNTSVALGLLQKGDNVQCDKCNSKAKDVMYESNINQDGEDTVKKCSICATVKKDKLPCATCLCNPKIVATASQEKNRHKKQRYVYDKHARNRISLKFKPGDSVGMHDNGQWKRAIVMEEAQNPRSYVLQAENGETYRRNMKMINNSPDEAVIVPETIDDQPDDIPVPPAIPEMRDNTEPEIRRSVRTRKAPDWHKDYVTK